MRKAKRVNSLTVTGVVVSVTLLASCGTGNSNNELSAETPDIGQAIDADGNQSAAAPLPVPESADTPESPESTATSPISEPSPVSEEQTHKPDSQEPGQETSIPENVICTANVSDIRSSVLSLINAARATSRSCGDILFEATEPVTWNSKLASAATTHSADMALHNFFSHTGSDGSNSSTRVDAQSYNWTNVGENIAAGQLTTKFVIDGWLESPSHCKNLMDSKFTEVAVACVENNESDYSYYWTNVLGTSF